MWKGRTSLVPTDDPVARSAAAVRNTAPRRSCHTRLAQTVADTIFDRPELELVEGLQPWVALLRAMWSQVYFEPPNPQGSHQIKKIKPYSSILSAPPCSTNENNFPISTRIQTQSKDRFGVS